MAIEFDHWRSLYATGRLEVKWTDTRPFFAPFVHSAVNSHVPQTFSAAVERVYTQVRTDEEERARINDEFEGHLFHMGDTTSRNWREVAVRLFERPFWSSSEACVAIAYGEAVAAIKTWHATEEAKTNPKLEQEAQQKHILFTLLQEDINAQLERSHKGFRNRLQDTFGLRQPPNLEGAVAMVEYYFTNPQKQARIFHLSRG